MKKVAVILFGLLSAVGFHFSNKTYPLYLPSIDSGRKNEALLVFDKSNPAMISEPVQKNPVRKVAQDLRDINLLSNISIEEAEAEMERDKVVSKLNDNLNPANERIALFKRLENLNALRKRQIEEDLAKIEKDLENLEIIQRERLASFGVTK